MAILGDLLVKGRSRFLQQIYAAALSISGDTSIAGTLTLTNTNNINESSYASPALVIGGASSASHLELDANEVVAKTGSGTSTGLYLNKGGEVYISKSGVLTTVRGNLTVAGTSTLTGNATASGTLTVNGTSLLKGKVTTNGDVAVGGALGVTGTTTLNTTHVQTTLMVDDEIRTPKFLLDNIANLGGEFVIAPTIICSNAATVSVGAASNNAYPITIVDSNSITNKTLGGIT